MAWRVLRSSTKLVLALTILAVCLFLLTMSQGELRPVIQSSYTPSEPVEEAIQRAADIIVREYVNNWFVNISTDDTTFIR